jgi:integrase
LTAGKTNKVKHGLHIVKRSWQAGVRWYIYAWRGGPLIQTVDGARPAISSEWLDIAAELRKESRMIGNNSLDALIQKYRQSPEYERLAPSTKVDYLRLLDRISAKFGPAPLEAFQDRRMRGEIMEWRDQWADKPRTADKHMVMMGTLLEWALQRGLVSINVASGIPSLHSADRSEIIWTDADWAALEPHASPELMNALRLCRFTGLRLGDLVSLEWEMVQENAIIAMTAKRKRRAVIPIFDELQELLNTLGERTGTVLKNSRGAQWTASGLGGVYQKAKNRASISVHIHDLRGTYVTYLCSMGLSNEEIARIVGWSFQTVEQVSARYVDELRVISSLSKRLNGQRL